MKRTKGKRKQRASGASERLLNSARLTSWPLGEHQLNLLPRRIEIIAAKNVPRAPSYTNNTLWPTYCTCCHPRTLCCFQIAFVRTGQQDERAHGAARPDVLSSVRGSQQPKFGRRVRFEMLPSRSPLVPARQSKYSVQIVNGQPDIVHFVVCRAGYTVPPSAGGPACVALVPNEQRETSLGNLKHVPRCCSVGRRGKEIEGGRGKWWPLC